MRFVGVAVVRTFREADQQGVRDLVLDGMRERWAERYDPTYNGDLDDIARTYVAAGAEVIVIGDSVQILATGILLSGADGRGRMVRVSVDAGRRREGLGRRVVEELVERARRRGMRELLVRTDTPWASAVALYVACGFVEVGRDEHDTHFALTL